MGTSIKMEASFMVEVKKVSGNRMMRDFIRFPWSAGIYDNDPAWIPPLVHDQETILNPQKSYFFEIGEAQLYLAYRGNVPVGRISAHVNHLYEEKYDSNTGFFRLL